MKLVISSQWNDDFLHECADHNVYEIYNSLRLDPIGSVRPAACLPDSSQEHIPEHISLAHSLGIRFNYVMNSSCLNNQEFTADGRKALYAYLEWLEEIGCDAVTVSIPYLIELIKKEFPRLNVKVSEIANVSTAQRARFFSKMGVDAITIEIVCNRNFKALQSIRKALDPEIELELVVNAGCLYQCPYHDYHNNMVAHTTQEHHELQGFYMDYCMMRCIPYKLESPVEIIKACWIRPEDISEYETIGISRFKISNRVGPLELGRRCLQAYSTRSCENLADLLTPLSLEIEEPTSSRLKSFTEREWNQIVKVWSIHSPAVYIDNKKLDGFIEHFKAGKCYGQCEADCMYCYQTAQEVVKVDHNEVPKYIAMISQLSRPLLEFNKTTEGKNTMEINWDNDIKEKYERIMADVPETFQDVARRAVSAEAARLSKERGAASVEEQDMVRALLSQTPDIFKKDMLESLKQEGINVSLYI